jgi:hypothetical protein
MSKIKVAMLGLFSAIGLGASANSAYAQIVPGWGYGRPIVVGGTAVTPGLGVTTATSAVDPFWGTQSHYRGYVNPYTGASFERRVVAGPFGGYSTIMVNNPTILPYPNPNWNPYWNVYGPYNPYTSYYGQAYYTQPQMRAYYNGVYNRR